MEYALYDTGMTLFQAVILGIVQGLSEFLPISSSGHLGLTQLLFGIDEHNLFFVIAIHIGTLVPVIVVYWRDIWEIIRRPFQKMTLLLILATIPAVVAGLFFEDRVESALANITFLAFGFTITGLILLFSDRVRKNKKTSDEITKVDAALVGLAQAVAIFPGISRSGSTIAMGLARGINREDAAKFAFLMSIPVILGAVFLQVLHLARGNIVAYDLNFLNLGAGILASGVSGYVAIRFMLAAVKKAKLKYFAYYMLVLALAVVVGVFVFNGGNS